MDTLRRGDTPSDPNRAALVAVGGKMGLPGSQIWLLLGGGAEDHRRVIGRVEEDQVEGHEMDDHPQEHHRGPSEPIVLAQQPEESSAWRISPWVNSDDPPPPPMS